MIQYNTCEGYSTFVVFSVVVAVFVVGATVVAVVVVPAVVSVVSVAVGTSGRVISNVVRERERREQTAISTREIPKMAQSKRMPLPRLNKEKVQNNKNKRTKEHRGSPSKEE